MSHKFALHTAEADLRNHGGSRASATQSNFPILRGLSVSKLAIEPGCFREPHWHANADELGYCLSGRSLVTIFSSGNMHACFTVEAGEMYFIPSGSLHAIENLGAEQAQFVITFSHEAVEDFGLSGFVGCMSPAVMGNVWGLPSGMLESLYAEGRSVGFGRSAGTPIAPEGAGFPHPWKFAIEARSPLVASANGSAIVARRDTWPVLRDQALYSLRLHGVGMREPHWHPQTAELGYVLEGHARMTVQSPDGGFETYELHPGEVYFIPQAYPHHIENLDGTEVRFLIFFDTPDVQDIGLTGAIPAFPDRVIGPTLGLDAATVARIPKLTSDLLLVSRINPPD
jgi:oxalate decarboxylase